jgi:hypothetical protein
MDLLNEYTAKPTVVNDDVGLLAQRQRSLNVKLIRVMEEDLNVGKHPTKHELMAMPQKRFDAYYARLTSAHENWYIAIAEHRFAYVLKKDLAAFQAREREQFT